MIHVSTHPLVKHKVTRLRAADTDPKEFRELVGELAQLLFYEATADLPTGPVTVRTPLADCKGELVRARIGIVPILRAGLGMAEAMLRVLPKAVVWHLGLYRDHETLEPVEYYFKIPPNPEVRDIIVLDPMLATGGSAAAACASLFAAGPARVTLLSVVAAPEGIRRLEAEHPALDVVTAAVDERLNDQAYIVPGLGDFGDRLFGT